MEHRVERFDVREFDLDLFPHLRTIAEDDHRNKVIEKAAQMAITSDCTLEAIHNVWGGKNWLYLFPTAKMLTRFVQPRFDKIIQQNPKLSELVRDTNNTNVKAIGAGTIYFSGLGSTTKEGGEYDVLSVPVDGVTFDERERMKPNRVKDALSRMKASPWKFQRRISTPKMPNYGIDEDYQQSDKKVLGFKCPACNHWNFYDDDVHFKLPNYIEWCLDRIRQGFLACEKCDRQVYKVQGQKHEFVAQRPEITDVSGYHVSGLYSPYADYRQITKDYHALASSRETQTYWNDTFGFPYLDVKAKLSKEQILLRCSGIAMALDDIGCYLGLDIGGARKGLHCVIAKPDGDWNFDIRWLGTIKEPDPNDPKFIEWLVQDVKTKMAKFGVKKGCSDTEPQHLSRAMANSIKKLWRVHYNDNQKGPYVYNDETKEIQVNRTESLDASHDILSMGKFRLPRRTEEVEAFAEHCSNIAKDEERDEDTGKVEYVWKKVGTYDDYRHAFNYMVIASGYDGRARLTPGPGKANLSIDDFYKPPPRQGSSIRLDW